MRDTKKWPGLRLTQGISPFGVGSIYAVNRASFVACDITCWDQRPREYEIIRLERLAAEMIGVENFRKPPHSNNLGSAKSRGLPFSRFPEYLVCESCHLIVKWNHQRENNVGAGQDIFCNCRRGRLTPIRFIAICPNGHLQDIDWHKWCHAKASNSRQVTCRNLTRLYYLVTGNSDLIDSITIECGACKARQSLRGLFSDNALLQRGIRCQGRQPWERRNQSHECDAIPIARHRGASNVYFPYVISALDIPPGSNWQEEKESIEKVKGNPNFESLINFGTPDSIDNNPIMARYIDGISASTGVPVKQVRQIVLETMLEGTSLASSGNQTWPDEQPADLRRQEWQILVGGHDRDVPQDNFISRIVPLLGSELEADPLTRQMGGLIENPVMVEKLREVRALQGYRRVSSAGQLVPPFPETGNPGWLPAIEVFGEGLFIRLNSSVLSNWEQQSTVQAQARRLALRFDSSRRSGVLHPFQPTPRFVLLHTLSHLLLRQLSFDCGYPSASLRERLYVDDEMAGILIYTSQGDSQGTLGGLVAQAESPYLVNIILRAIATAHWCSADPICREVDGQGPDSLNLAACHACALVPETSCECTNILLDRTLVVGNRVEGIPGYFSSLPLKI